MSNDIAQPVSAAIAELRANFSSCPVEIEPDGSGGARVLIENADLGPPYQQEATWIGAHLPSQLPYSDVYPLFVRGDLIRLDKTPLGEGMASGHNFMSRTAIQVSRRSNHSDFSIQSPAMKFMKVIYWMRTKH